MKNLFKFILIAVLFVGFSSSTFAQRSGVNRSAGNNLHNANNLSLIKYQKKVDDFISAIGDENISRARRIKADILNIMKDEIQLNHEKNRAEQRELSRYPQKNTRQTPTNTTKTRRPQNRFGYRSDQNSRDVDFSAMNTAQLLEKQMEIAKKLQELYLEATQNYWRQAREHENLMYEFERTLRRR